MKEVPIYYIKNARLTFGGKPLFEGLSCQIMPGDKISLVGKNGSGKSTLLKAIASIIEFDDCEQYIEPNLKIGYLPQAIDFKNNETVYDYALGDLTEQEKLEKKYLVDMILDNLKLSGDKVMEKLSGGKLRRASLAKALAYEPDLLLLDEPTNHLDISAILWLEEYINNFKGAVICISHDRTFLSNITKKTFWLDRGILRTNNKGFGYFDEWALEILEREEAELAKMSKKLDTENHWLAHGVTARRKRNQQRLRSLFSLREKLKNDRSHLNKATSRIKLPALSERDSAKLVAEMEEICHAYTDVDPPKKTINNLTLRILKGEKIGIVGKNGAGKTTFIKLITGEAKPISGYIKLGVNLDISYLDQKKERPDPNETLWQNLCPNGGDSVISNGKHRHVVAYLKDFMFDSTTVKSAIGTLSGGQYSRFLLAKVLLNPGNLLILDEPTNDLDIDTLDMLQELLSDYTGTLLIVSHDRDFLDKLVTRTIVFESNGEIGDYIGGYRDYLEATKNNDQAPTKKNVIKQEDTKQEEVKKPNKLSYKHKRELDILPGLIDQLNNEIKELEIKLSDPELYNKSPENFHKYTEILQSKKVKLSNAEDKWLELEEMRLNYEK